MLLLFRDGVLWRFSIPLSNTHTLKTHETHNNTHNKSEKKKEKKVSNKKAKKPPKKQYLLILVRKPFRS